MYLETYSWNEIKEIAGNTSKYSFFKRIFKEAGIPDLTFDCAVPIDWLNNLLKEVENLRKTGVGDVLDLDDHKIIFSTVWIYSKNSIFGQPVTVLKNLEKIIGRFEIPERV